jgi:hypothetical protein
MVVWLEHPRYVPARDRLIEYLRSSRYRFRRLDPVLFLCGAAASKPRDSLRDYLRKRVQNVSLFYAERVWEQIASSGDRSALKMESDLALLADMLVIIVESPGTFAELGAFSLSNDLRKKILPIVDKQYRHQEKSFISTGPLRWIDSDSNFAPTIYVSLSMILEAVDEIEERISRIPKSRTVKITDLAESPKHLLFFLCDLISIIHPATVEVVNFYLERIAPSILSSGINVATLMGLGVAMDLLQAEKVTVSGSVETFYSPMGPDAIGHPFHHPRLLDMESLRATHVSVLLALPEAKAVLDRLGEAS